MPNDSLIEQIALGSLFGDGYITKQYGENRHCSLQICHHNPQGPYLQWKAQLLKDAGLRVRVSEHDLPATPKKSERKSYSLETQAHPVFTGLRQQWYTGKTKYFTRHSFNKLNDLGLAIWYMDDGELCRYRQKSGYLAINGYLHTESFGHGGNVKLCEYFAEQWDLHPKVIKRARYFYLRFCLSEMQKLRDIIYHYIHPIFGYKLDLSTKEVHAAVEHNATYPELIVENDLKRGIKI